MSGDEIFALIVCIVVGAWGWKDWLGGLFFVQGQNRKVNTHLAGFGVPLLAALLMLFVLLKWSSSDVRNDIAYVLFYLAIWFGWLGATLLALPYLGLSARDDIFERQNPAAAMAVSGAVIGVTLAFAGGHIGDGPGWWVVLFSGGLGTGTLLALWVIGNWISQTAEAITVDRDQAAGWRAAGYFIGGGAVVGRAAAGNWTSAEATMGDFIGKGWPVLILWGLAATMDMALRPSPQNPTPSVAGCGFLPALLLLAVGMTAAWLQGPW